MPQSQQWKLKVPKLYEPNLFIYDEKLQVT